MKHPFVKYCIYTSILLLIVAIFIIFSNDQRITFANSMRKAFEPGLTFQFFFTAIFFFCIINQFILVITGTILMFRKRFFQASLFIFSSIVFFLTVLKYIGDSW
jgi:hypothetical protein